MELSLYSYIGIAFGYVIGRLIGRIKWNKREVVCPPSYEREVANEAKRN